MLSGEQNEPPALFRETSPGTLELREGGGCSMLFGIPFFLVGIFIAWTAGGLPFLQTPPGPPHVLLGLMSVVFLCVGGLLSFGRKWLTLDRNTGTLLRQWGLFIPMRSQERRLSEFSAVVITYYRGDNDTPERYPVWLRAKAGKDFPISKPGEFSESRKQAEFLSRFLRLPLADATTDHETVVAPDRAGAPLRERLGVSERPARPAVMRSEVNESTGNASVVIPGGKSALGGALSAFFPFLFLIGVSMLMRMFERTGTPWGVRSFFLILITLVFGIPAIIFSANRIAVSARKRTTVRASPAGLIIEQRTAWRTQETTLPAADILDLDYASFEGELQTARNSAGVGPLPSPRAEKLFTALQKLVPTRGIIVKSRQGLTTFGQGLHADELRYVSWVLKKALAG